MSDDFYLNDERREFYSNALDLIRSCDSEFWDLDLDLEKYIDSINENSNIRTMYSRNGSAHMNDILGSYLTICYSEQLEQLILNNLIPTLETKFSELEDSEFEFTRKHPRKQVPAENVNPYLKYIDHADYWNVYHIKFEFRSYFSNNHKLFWEQLAKGLNTL